MAALSVVSRAGSWDRRWAGDWVLSLVVYWAARTADSMAAQMVALRVAEWGKWKATTTAERSAGERALWLARSKVGQSAAWWAAVRALMTAALTGSS